MHLIPVTIKMIGACFLWPHDIFWSSNIFFFQRTMNPFITWAKTGGRRTYLPFWASTFPRQNTAPCPLAHSHLLGHTGLVSKRCMLQESMWSLAKWQCGPTQTYVSPYKSRLVQVSWGQEWSPWGSNFSLWKVLYLLPRKTSMNLL